MENFKIICENDRNCSVGLIHPLQHYTQGYGQCDVMTVHKNADMCREEYTA